MLVSRLRALGQVAWSFPLIEFTPGRELNTLPERLSVLGKDDMVFALSQHAVTFAHAHLQQTHTHWPLQPATLLLVAQPRWRYILQAVLRFAIRSTRKSAKSYYNCLNYKTFRANVR
jgi:hypothetical protein